MTTSPTHRFGQIIGDLVEEALREPLAVVAARHGLYLDWKRPRPVRNGKSKVGWMDGKGNRHDLDYVLEAGGTDTQLGRPKAFIEIAYRRYTKHSRNKAQEIQGAIAPLAEAYAHDHPFIGVVLAGVFTDGAIQQLRSNGFGVLYVPFDSITAAFEVVGIDANFDEDSTDSEVREKVDAWDELDANEHAAVLARLRELQAAEIGVFLIDLEGCLTRTIRSVSVLGLHGVSRDLGDVAAAIAFIESFDEKLPGPTFVRYEVHIRYTNEDDVRATFVAKADAIRFLNQFA